MGGVRGCNLTVATGNGIVSELADFRAIRIFLCKPAKNEAVLQEQKDEPSRVAAGTLCRHHGLISTPVAQGTTRPDEARASYAPPRTDRGRAITSLGSTAT